MLFAHDTEVALQAAAALVNTDRREGDRLVTVADLDRLAAEWRWTGSRQRDSRELGSVRELRPRLRRLWSGEEDEVVGLVNAMLAEAGALPQLARHDGWAWHLHATAPAAPLADRMSVEAAMALVDVVRQGELSRLRVCEASGCEDLYVDLSRNQSKRYCSVACANRTNVAAYRARQRP